jgi:hypothetical protein
MSGGLSAVTGLNVEAGDDQAEETDCDVGIRSGRRISRDEYRSRTVRRMTSGAAAARHRSGHRYADRVAIQTPDQRVRASTSR